MNKQTFNRYTVEQRLGGTHVVYGWDKYPAGSVLARQDRKNYLGSFDSYEEAISAYPEAKMSNRWVDPQPSFTHLPEADH